MCKAQQTWLNKQSDFYLKCRLRLPNKVMLAEKLTHQTLPPTMLGSYGYQS